MRRPRAARRSRAGSPCTGAATADPRVPLSRMTDPMILNVAFLVFFAVGTLASLHGALYGLILALVCSGPYAGWSALRQ